MLRSPWTLNALFRPVSLLFLGFAGLIPFPFVGMAGGGGGGGNAACSAADASELVFREVDGLVAVEAEDFVDQSVTQVRRFYRTDADTSVAEENAAARPDGDPPHWKTASARAYLEILPDTRRTHDDKLIKGENFSDAPGKLAVLRYRVHFSTPGTYYVWVRAFSTGTEDNGLHVGLNGTWPESGRRMQWCEGKRAWRWESRQRTPEQHCGEPHRIFLEIPEPGVHTIEFSMREDGFEFDKWLMTTDRAFTRPDDAGPAAVRDTSAEVIRRATTSPNRDSEAKASKNNRLHRKTIDRLNQSGTPANPKLATFTPPARPTRAIPQTLLMPARAFTLQGTGFYLDQGKWAAINPARNTTATAGRTCGFPTGRYDITLLAIGESDGQSTYAVFNDGAEIGRHTCPLADESFADARKYRKTWPDVFVSEGAVLSVQAQIASADGAEHSRGRWAGLRLKPADDATRRAVAPLLERRAREAAVPTDRTKASPTRPLSTLPLILPRMSDGDATVQISGERKQWHRITLTLQGPFAHEQDNAPNPFTDHAMNVTFTHTDGTRYRVPGFFAADGNAQDSSAESGTAWRCHFAPDRVGKWKYKISFRTGKHAALNPHAALDPSPADDVDPADDLAARGKVRSGVMPVAPFDGVADTFDVGPSDKVAPDLRAKGRLVYVGRRYLRHAGSGDYFLKAGADAPETLLGFADFDNTIAGKPKRVPLKHFRAHVKDWRPGDPTWKNDRGKGLIGAINYLSGKGCNAFSFLTYNAGGDGDNVWPFIDRDDKMHYDCSKLDQWSTVFDHGTARGMYLHFKLQETENDDTIAESLDAGELGPQRKLYFREMIARFGHNLALNWNLGEENTQSTDAIRRSLDFIDRVDPYGHNRVLHTFPKEQDKRYLPLLGDQSGLTGVSLQNSSIADTHRQTLKWIAKSTQAGRPWVVAFDESGNAAHAQCPDLGYQGYDGRDRTGKMTYTQHRVRKQTLWGTLMAGGAGVEYYFGYQYVENDLVCEDWRSRDQSWDYCRIALEFFERHQIPFAEMANANALVGNDRDDNSKYCFAKPGEVYVVYLADSADDGPCELDLADARGDFTVQWFNPRSGGELSTGSVRVVTAGDGREYLGNPPAEAEPAPTGGPEHDRVDDDARRDWVVLVRSAR